MFVDWVLGVLFRPAATFEWAQRNIRLGYWWILISDITLNVVIAVYSRPLPGEAPIPASDMAWRTITLLVLLFDLQALILFGVSKAFGWQITWPGALKFIALTWSILLVQDIVLFYPALKGLDFIAFWGNAPFLLWYLIALTVGVKRVSGFATWKSLLLVSTATLPWEIAIMWANWKALHH